MVKTLDVKTGKLIKKTGWGMAIINGVRGRGAVCVIKYENGFIIKFRPIFGGGKLWIPKSGFQIIKETEARFIMPSFKHIQSGSNEIKVYGDLAKIFQTA